MNPGYPSGVPTTTISTSVRTCRALAVAAGVAVAAGAALLSWAVAASQGWWYAGFVSETGEPGSPQGTAYRLGILGLAAGLFLLAGAVRARGGSPAWIVLGASLLLAVSGAFAVTSSVVSCSSGCPLPPYETPTAGDLVHAGASIAGILAAAAAMLALAIGQIDSGLRRACRAWLAVTVPAGLFAAFALIGLGRGHATGLAEKLLLAVVVGWALTTAWQLARSV
jgi:Protein of unknown function (DUF998)